MICIDTNILVWGVRRIADPTRPDIVDRCAQLISDHHERRITIMVPSVVLAEYLMGHTADERKAQMDVVGKHFFIGAFDTQAAIIAAELYDKETFDRIKDTGVPRQCLKADYKIIATAIRHSASTIYANDPHFGTIGRGKIMVKDVPPLRVLGRVAPVEFSDDGDLGDAKGDTKQGSLPGMDEEE